MLENEEEGIKGYSPNNESWQQYANNKFDNIDKIMGGIIIVFFVAFLSMLVSYWAVLSDSWNHKEDVYYQLLEKVNQNNCEFIKIK